jgi:glutamine amidotransferase-like uncharacterized protein
MWPVALRVAAALGVGFTPLVMLLAVRAADDDRTSVDVVVAEGLTEWDRINLERNLRWILSREHAARVRGEARAGEVRVGVFADAGVWHTGARSIVEALESRGIACQVLDRAMLREEDLARFEAIVLPGGWAPFQWAALGEPGLAALRDYVEGGGRCLGICAGAYLLSRTTRYDGVDYPYPLGLFDGTADGPVEGLARFPKPGEARLTVTAEGRRCGLAALASEPCYYSGGPCFVGGTNVEVLARYADGRPAAIRRKVGRGEIILMGVHPERPVPGRGDDSAPPPALAGRLLGFLLSPEK